MSREKDRTTIYLEDRHGFRRWIKQLEVESDDVLEAEKNKIHQTIVEVAQAHEDEIIRRLESDAA